MSSFQLPPVASLGSLSTVERATVLDMLFEPCNALHTLSVDLLRTETFESYDDLIAGISIQLNSLSESPSTSDTDLLDAILGAHPRLGEKKVDSAQSRAEQAQLNTGSEQEASVLHRLNEEYEKTFPGLKYVYAKPRIEQASESKGVLIHFSVFVNGRTRPVIMDDMRQRIARGNMKQEREDAIKVKPKRS
jgi:2-oxo-4-hydroxy-4-carboxy--5-ureidoimidazoline (OHCU) decarboxylase